MKNLIKVDYCYYGDYYPVYKDVSKNYYTLINGEYIKIDKSKIIDEDFEE